MTARTRSVFASALVLSLATIAVLAISAVPAGAAAIPITGVYGHNEKTNYTGTITDMIIGSGMNGYGVDGKAGWPAGEGDPSTWTATSTNYGCEWQSGDLLAGTENPTNGKIGWAIFDLGAAAVLDDLYIWNERENSARYTKTFNVYVAETPTVAPTHGPTGSSSIDYDFSSGGWTLINTGGALTGTWKGSQVVDLGGITGQYVAIEILSNGGDAARVGLAEVAITPEPATLALVGVGALLLLRRRRYAA